MKTKNKDKEVKLFDTVKTFRKIKEDIASDISEMSFEEIKKYLQKNKLKTAKYR